MLNCKVEGVRFEKQKGPQGLKGRKGEAEQGERRNQPTMRRGLGRSGHEGGNLVARR